MRIEYTGYTDIGTRRENQDSSAVTQPGDGRLCAIVADGLGGHEGGRAASLIAVRHMTEGWEGARELPTEEQLNGRLTAANEEILATRRDENDMKSTVVALYVWGREAQWVHIGDSRLYHYVNGSLAHYTRDHSLPQIAVRMGEITRNQIPDHPDRSKLLRVLGTEELRPEFSGVLELQEGIHAFLLCSDGFWEHLNEDEIFLDLNKSSSAAQWLDFLRMRVMRRMGANEDNNTAITVFLEV